MSSSSVTTPSTATSAHLLSSLRRAFPTVASFTVLHTIIQSNAKGYILQLHNSKEESADTTTPARVFVKLVQAAEYVPVKKDWPDLRRTLMYARTEERFYAVVQPILAQHGFVNATPTCYLSETNLTGWIDQTERATDPADPAVDKDTLVQKDEDPETKGGLLILECISADTHLQDSPLNMSQCRDCLAAVARLHAAAWQDVALLQRADVELSKASFHLSTRNPKELAGIKEAWSGFCRAFAEEMQQEGLFVSTTDDDNDNRIAQLGARLATAAEYVSRQVSPQPHEPYATLIHGDYKAMNAFLPRDPTDHSAILVDFASTGCGLGMSDVAMHIHHAVVPEQLEAGGEEALVKYYWQTLNDALTAAGHGAYPWEQAWRHYRLAVVDYGRFFMARMWKGATPATMLKKKDNKNVNLINRSPPAAMAFIRRLDTYLAGVEKEMAENGFNKDEL